MKINSSSPICRDRWLAALHVKGQAGAQLTAQFSEAEKLLFAAASPKGVYKIMERNDVKTKGFSIEKHLEGCYKVIVMAATLGIGVDNLLRKTQVTDMAMAVMIDSGASVLVEQVCDDFEQRIRQRIQGSELNRGLDAAGLGADRVANGGSDVVGADAGRAANGELNAVDAAGMNARTSNADKIHVDKVDVHREDVGEPNGELNVHRDDVAGPDVAPLMYMTSRFSPGYGDYPLTEQSRIIGYLDAQRQIGLHVTSDSLMIPGKSITALIGIADHPVTGRLATCNECVLKEKCTLRKEGKFCGD